jgi:pectate lyase
MRRVIEAETMTLTAPMMVGVDADANGAQYISATSGTNSTVPVREASTTVTAPAAGTYYLWARLKGAGIDSDALYVGFNNTWDRVFPSTTGSYEWVRVETGDGSAAHGFSLSAGEHIIQVGHGEIGARLDAVYVTDDANDSPTGPTSPPAPPGGPCAIPSNGYEGFGRDTTGGLGQLVYRVTTLANSGAGSLRDALSVGNRCIVFDVGGTIDMTNSSSLNVRSNVTIDGLTAPSPGITLVNNKPTGADEGAEPPVITISNVNNVVVRGIRIRKSPGDAIRVVNSAFNVVLDRVSITRFGDGAIDVTLGSRNVTIQWSILGDGGNPEHNFVSLLKYAAARISVHHNLFINGRHRQPHCARDDNAGTQLPLEIVCDVRNNLVWNYLQSGSAVWSFGTGNVINNYYKAAVGAIPERTIWVTNGGVAYVSGNISQDGFSINDNGNRSTPWPVDPADVPTTTDARTAAQAVRAGAGARGPNFGLDTTDQTFINGISIP